MTATEFVSDAGTAQTAQWISQWSLLQQPSRNEEGELTAAQAFEMTYILTVSRTLWLYAADDLFLALGLVTAAWLIYSTRHPTTGCCHAILGIVAAMVGCLDFAFEVNYGKVRSVSAHILRAVRPRPAKRDGPPTRALPTRRRSPSR